MPAKPWIALVACVLLSACAHSFPAEPRFDSGLLLPMGVDAQGNPVRSNALRKTPSQVVQPIPASCYRFDKSGTSADRNSCVLDLKTHIDEAFGDYVDRFQSGIGGTNFGLNMANLTLGTASTAIGDATAKTVFSAMSTVVTGTKSAIGEDLLMKSSVELLVNQMVADRAKKFADISASMQLDINQYSMAQARNDLLAYFAAGTLSNALVSTRSQSGANVVKCQAAEAAVRAGVSGVGTTAAPVGDTAATGCNQGYVAEYNADDSSAQLRALWKPDGQNINTANQAIIKTCMTTPPRNITTSITAFMLSGSPQDRQAVLACAIAAGAK